MDMQAGTSQGQLSQFSGVWCAGLRLHSRELAGREMSWIIMACTPETEQIYPICLFFSIRPGKLVGPHPSSRWDRKIAFVEIKESCEKNPANICDDRYLG